MNAAIDKATLLQLTPGAGAMYCGNCLRDNALVAALRRQGHAALMVPLYLPLTLDEADQSAATPVFFSGINVYLDQQFGWFRRAPRWLHHLLAARPLLKLAAGKAGRTRAAELGDLTLSMLRGEAGNQSRELEELIAWLKTQPRPDVICLSNALLIGMARRLRQELRAPVLCMLQGEDGFLDALPEPQRGAAWQIVRERAANVDRFVSPSRYFAELMASRLNLAAGRVEVVHNGIDLAGYERPDNSGGRDAVERVPTGTGSDPSDEVERVATGRVLGYFARMCPEKGLGTLVEAYLLLRQKGVGTGLKLKIGGSCGPADAGFVQGLRERLQEAGASDGVEFHPNLDRADKVAFLRSLSVFSAPAIGEAFGLYVIEALAAGVPVVQPRSGAFPELIEATGGGLVCAPNDAVSLAAGIERLLRAPEEARALGNAGRRKVFEQFSADAMAGRMLAVCRKLAYS